MLRTYLFALIIGFQTFFGINSSTVVEENLHMFESLPVTSRELNTSQIVPLKDVDENYIGRIESLGITLHPGSDFAPDDNANERELNECASLVYDVFSVMPPDIVAKVKNLTLYFNSHGRRGLGGGSTIILRCQNVTDEELIGVLVHELGHIADTGLLLGSSDFPPSEFVDGKKPVYLNDKSLQFYRLSFRNESTLKRDATDADFVSGYAKTDPFEDFAETFNFYLLHGEVFRKIMKENKILQKKYQFMKEQIFDGQEFYYESESLPPLEGYRVYDATTLGYNYKVFLANT